MLPCMAERFVAIFMDFPFPSLPPAPLIVVKISHRFALFICHPVEVYDAENLKKQTREANAINF